MKPKDTLGRIQRLLHELSEACAQFAGLRERLDEVLSEKATLRCENGRLRKELSSLQTAQTRVDEPQETRSTSGPQREKD